MLFRSTGHFPDPQTLYTAIFLKGYQWPFNPKKVENYGSSLIDLLVQQETASGRKVYIDFTRNPEGFSQDKMKSEAREYLEKSGALAETPIERLRLLNQPAIDLYKSHGIDITREPLEIAVCAQHNNGGLTGDIWWESNIRYLFPIGEVNGSHGNTRPGGAALNSGQVGGIRATMRIKCCDAKRVTRDTKDVTASRDTFHGKIAQLLAGTGTLDFHDALAELQARMSDHGGPVRNPETISREVKNSWDLWHRLNHDLQPVAPSELVSALRVSDLCLTHCVYLEAIAESLNPSIDKNQNILEISLDENLHLVINRVPVRPIPKEEMWFEEVWKEFRNKENYTELHRDSTELHRE